MKNPRDYSFLNKIVAEFVREKGIFLTEEDIKPHYAKRESFDKKLSTLQKQSTLTSEEINTFITPIEKLSPEKLILISSLQTELSQLVHDPPLSFVAQPVPKTKENRALDWTIIHLDQLGLTGLKPKKVYLETGLTWTNLLGEGFLKPYKQCYWCGKIDDDNSFVRKTRKYCHQTGCDGIGSNPSEHADCCSGKWGALRRRYKEKLRYYSETYKPKEEKERVIESFRQFCDERFTDNLKKENEVIDSTSYSLIQFQRRVQQFIASPKFEKFSQDIEQVIQQFIS